MRNDPGMSILTKRDLRRIKSHLKNLEASLIKYGTHMKVYPYDFEKMKKKYVGFPDIQEKIDNLKKEFQLFAKVFRIPFDTENFEKFLKKLYYIVRIPPKQLSLDAWIRLQPRLSEN